MSLKPQPIQPVPQATARIARAAFPKGNPYLTLRDELGPLFRDEDFADCFPDCGQPGLPPWRLALVTVLQFGENLSDRQAAEAVRARIDWKYLLGLELTDPGFDFSVLSEFRARLIAGGAQARLLDTLLEGCRAQGLVKARGQQRTDSTHVLAAIRVLNRLELVAETLRAALNELATVAPDWLRGIAPADWYERYGRRIEDTRLPKTDTERQAYLHTVGDDGFRLLTWLDAAETPAELTRLPKVEALRTAWRRHYERDAPPVGPPYTRVKTPREVAQAPEQLESPYDPDARYRSKHEQHWTGYMVHLSETCDADAVHLITQVHTTPADVHEARCTAAIHQGLAAKGLSPDEHFVDSAYIAADLLVQSARDYGITLFGPPHENVSWQAKHEDAYPLDRFVIDWEARTVRCPEGKQATAWHDYVERDGTPYSKVTFPSADCRACSSRSRCTTTAQGSRRLKLQPRAEYEALHAARERLASEEGQRRYTRRAGVEGTLSQGVRAFGLRRSRYCGLVKTHVQHLATAAAMNIERLVAWLEGIPRAKTRVSRFAALTA